MNRILQTIAWITIVTSLFLVVIVFYWIFCPYVPIEFTSQPQRVESSVVKSGEYLTFEDSYCKTDSVTPLVSRSFVDGIIYTIPTSVSTLTSDGCYSSKVKIYVPKAIPPGEYYLKSVYQSKINPLRTITTVVVTEKFTVIE